MAQTVAADVAVADCVGFGVVEVTKIRKKGRKWLKQKTRNFVSYDMIASS